MNCRRCERVGPGVAPPHRLPSLMFAGRKLQKTWMPARDNYLVPVKALSRLFRGIFLERIRRQFKEIHLPESIWQKDWVVHCKPAVQGTRTILNYLARYIHRVAITNSRIVSIDNGKVTFRYKDSKSGAQIKTMTVSAEEFIHIWLLPSEAAR